MTGRTPALRQTLAVISGGGERRRRNEDCGKCKTMTDRHSTPPYEISDADEVPSAHSDDRDQSFQRIATSVTRLRDGAVGCCF